MLSGIFLSDGRRQKVILRIIVNHCLGHHLVIAGITCRLTKILVHERRHLIHIEVYVWNVRGLHIADSVKAFHDAV